MNTTFLRLTRCDGQAVLIGLRHIRAIVPSDDGKGVIVYLGPGFVVEVVETLEQFIAAAANGVVDAVSGAPSFAEIKKSV